MKSGLRLKTKSYADSLKTKKVLLIKANQENQKAADKKKAIMSKIATPVEEVKTTRHGHLYVRFDDTIKLEEAKRELEGDVVNDITVNEKGKLNPKIKIVNVSKDENKDDIINNIRMKNGWLNSLIDDENDFKHVGEHKAKDSNNAHHIIKCTPKIRRAIFDRKDKLYTLYSHCKVYDSYSPFQCFKCQEFGHSAASCKNNMACSRCGGSHKSSECLSSTEKCKNCAKRNIKEDNHSTYDRNKCATYRSEIIKTKNNTDHGFN